MKTYNSHITVERKKNEDFDIFMQRFKKRVRDSRLFLEMESHRFFEKPSLTQHKINCKNLHIQNYNKNKGIY